MAANSPKTVCKAVQAIPYQTISSNGTTTGTIIDTLGYTHAMVILDAGTFTSSATLDVKVCQDDAVGFGSTADITGAVFTQITTSNDVAGYVGTIYLQGKERFIRCSMTHGGTGNALISGWIVLMNAEDSALQTTAATSTAALTVTTHTFDV